MDNGVPDMGSSWLPETDIDKSEIEAEQKVIKYLKSAEWKLIKSHLEDRKSFYKAYLPSGESINDTNLTNEELGRRWRNACAIISEIDNLIGSFEIKGNG